MRHRHLATLALPLLALALAAPAQAARDSGDLYLQEASGGSLKGSKLVLKGVDRRVTTFTDRPERQASSQSTSSFVSRFGRTFRGDPPNAALQLDGRSAKRDVALLELRRPRYDRRARTLTYTVRRLARSRSRGQLKGLSRKADRGVRGRFRSATLFIDSGGAGDFFSFEISAPAGQTTSMTLGGGASFDFEDSSQIVPVGRTAPPDVQIQGTTLSVTPTQFAGLTTVLVQMWIDDADPPLTGTAAIPSGGSIEVDVDGGPTNITLPNGPFSVPFQ